MLLLTSLALAVVGGEEVDGEYPEVVAVLRGGTCTGTLIHPQWVLSAAHCWEEIDLANPPDAMGLVTPVDDLGVFADPGTPSDTGVVDTGPVAPPTQIVEAQIASVHVHPGYVSIGYSPNSVAQGAEHENDVALLHLAQPMTGPVVQLNDRPLDDTWIGVQPTFVGYGITVYQGSDSGIKRTVDLPIAAVADERFETFHPERSLCQGDSGGPALVRGDGGRWVQIGVASFGRPTCERGHNMPVDAYLGWIRGVLDGAPIEVVSADPPPPLPMDWDTADTGAPDFTTPDIAPASSWCSVTSGPAGAGAGLLVLLGVPAIRRRQRGMWPRV